MSMLSVRSPRRKIRRPFGEGVLLPVQATDADRAWLTGFGLGREGVNALAPSGWCDVLKDQFYDGHGWGLVQRDADLQAEYERESARAETEGSPW